MSHSQDSTTTSGYWSSHASTPALETSTLNHHYLCYWRDSCNGTHEMNQCDYWESDLVGKLGVYFSPSNDYKIFTRDIINGKDLTGNPTGCTTVHVLVYNKEKKEVLFGLKRCKENKGSKQSRSLQLVFPSAKPYQRDGNMLLVARRAFQWLTTDTDLLNQCLEQGLIKRFLFQYANVIYPVLLTNEQALELTRTFVRNEELQSLHWYPLSEVLSQLPRRSHNITRTETDIELVQTSRDDSTRIQLGGHQLWSVTAVCLRCIRTHVPGGIESFLNV